MQPRTSRRWSRQTRSSKLAVADSNSDRPTLGKESRPFPTQAQDRSRLRRSHRRRCGYHPNQLVRRWRNCRSDSSHKDQCIADRTEQGSSPLACRANCHCRKHRVRRDANSSRSRHTPRRSLQGRAARSPLGKAIESLVTLRAQTTGAAVPGARLMPVVKAAFARATVDACEPTTACWLRLAQSEPRLHRWARSGARRPIHIQRSARAIHVCPGERAEPALRRSRRARDSRHQRINASTLRWWDGKLTQAATPFKDFSMA